MPLTQGGNGGNCHRCRGYPVVIWGNGGNCHRHRGYPVVKEGVTGVTATDAGASQW